ncbi:hypothetical protein COY95_01115 [Candidatus Woesearchaeota archaeon CG_4_10_14_0_8_um_filter_47_5]|nr:MAG: hypothetical protein COY95_01115 [Candidatus Woesearchaeota archaeon CG_4_10_14_0_8_um_filter_47_5]
MEKYEEALEKARRKLHIADHMVCVTYPLLRDNKLLVAALENLFLALTNSMGALLYYERLYKQVPPFHDTFESKFNLFKLKMVRKYRFDTAYLPLMEEIKNIIIQHRKSPVEFARKDSFVICTDNYRTFTVTLVAIKGYIAKTKTFLEKIQSIVEKNLTKNERITVSL